MLYKKNSSPTLSHELFRNPSSEYRSTPFWAWNSSLDKEELKRQIDIFREMGFGGFHMHVRQGLEDEYLGEKFMDAVKFSVNYAKECGMLAWLYDEDRWPSGVSGGEVTKTLRHRMKYLTMSERDREGCAKTPEEAANTGKPYFVAAFSVLLDPDGRMLSYRPIGRDERAEGKRYFFIEQRQGGEPRYNYQAYVDVLSKEAIDSFIEKTHERFFEAVGDEFGKTVPAIFTDEPQVAGANFLHSAFDTRDAQYSWTTDFSESYEREFGVSPIPTLPELFFATDMPSASESRYRYFSHLAERFGEAYMDNIGDWCERHGIMLTGHVIGEDNLYEAALNNADIMRTYRKMQLPGIDLLCDDIVFSGALQCRSVVRQTGREAMLSELYGVTGWDFDFRGHKYQGDWQAALGVSVRVPHLAWQTMKGEGKRDYPASISYQSAWYREYKYLEDHYARINTALTRGKPRTRVAVIYPIDSYNILFASKLETLAEREDMDRRYRDVSDWLLSSGFEFDYISESLLPELCEEGANPLSVGKMKYDAVVVANCTTLRPHTIKVLGEFSAHGGRLLFVGRRPEMSSGRPSQSARELVLLGEWIEHSEAELVRALAPYRDFDIRNSLGARASGLIVSSREDSDGIWLFLAHMHKPELPHSENREDITVCVKGCYTPYLYNTLSGDILLADYSSDGEKTTVRATLYDLDTLLLKFEVSDKRGAYSCPRPVGKKIPVNHPSLLEYSLSEPGVLLLDSARYSVDGEPLSQNPEEIMRIDSAVRERLGLATRRTKVVQPWAVSGSPEDHTLKLSFSVKSDTAVKGARLALENPEKASICFNGAPVSNKAVGWYVDRGIKTVLLPEIPKGESELVVEMPFGLRTDLEAMYIVGDLGSSVIGRECRICALPDKLHFGSVTNQGLAFYGGNIDYHAEIELESESDIELCVSHYRGALVSVSLDGECIGKIVGAPFKLYKSAVAKGKHKLTYTLFGTRYNTFSALHNLNASKKRIYMGPDFWRSEGVAWAYEYETRPMGILKTPEIWAYRREK